jgi:hypothetical protein
VLRDLQALLADGKRGVCAIHRTIAAYFAHDYPVRRAVLLRSWRFGGIFLNRFEGQDYR